MASLTEDQWTELVEFYHLGHTYKECGIKYGISISAVHRYFKKHPEIPRRKPLQAARGEKAENPEIMVMGRVRVEENTPPLPNLPRKRVVKLKGE